MTKRTLLVRFYCAAGLILVLCQVVSAIVEKHLPLGQSKEWTSFLFLTHVRNHGGVFGVLQGMGWVFALGASLVLVLVVVFLHRSSGLKPFEYVCYGFIVGGGLSNVIDRIIYGSVIDYIDVQGISWWAYIFNLADVSIHVGIWPVLLLSLVPAKGEKEVGES